MPFRIFTHFVSSIQPAVREIVSLFHTDFHYRARLLFFSSRWVFTRACREKNKINARLMKRVDPLTESGSCIGAWLRALIDSTAHNAPNVSPSHRGPFFSERIKGKNPDAKWRRRALIYNHYPSPPPQKERRARLKLVFSPFFFFKKRRIAHVDPGIH